MEVSQLGHTKKESACKFVDGLTQTDMILKKSANSPVTND